MSSDQSIAYSAQDPHILSGTVEENILFPASLLDEKTDSVRQRCGELIRKLGLQDRRKALPQTLSGGEKQRVAIARTLLTNSSILIFDDSTSSVDAGTDARIRLALKELTKGQTTVIIAHRLSSLKHAEEILVLDSGEVIERGTHDELVQLGGRYSELWDLQRGDLGTVEE